MVLNEVGGYHINNFQERRFPEYAYNDSIEILEDLTKI